IGPPPLVLGPFLAGDGIANRVPAEEPERFGGEPAGGRSHETGASPFVIPSQREGSEDPSSQVRGANAVARIAHANEDIGTAPQRQKNGSPVLVRSMGPVQLEVRRTSFSIG